MAPSSQLFTSSCRYRIIQLSPHCLSIGTLHSFLDRTNNQFELCKNIQINQFLLVRFLIKFSILAPSSQLFHTSCVSRIRLLSSLIISMVTLHSFLDRTKNLFELGRNIQINQFLVVRFQIKFSIMAPSRQLFTSSCRYRIFQLSPHCLSIGTLHSFLDRQIINLNYAEIFKSISFY